MSTYLISDIHGCHAQLQELLDKISPTSDDQVHILGDLADRGPESAATLMWATSAPSNFHFLLGNHDMILRDSLRENPERLSIRASSVWPLNGGHKTARQIMEQTDADWRRDVLAPFIESLLPYDVITSGDTTTLVVHAGFDLRACCDDAPMPDAYEIGNDYLLPLGLGMQNENVMCWVRCGWFDADAMPPALTIFGHTPTTFLAGMQRDRIEWLDVLEEDGEAPSQKPVWLKHPCEKSRIWQCDRRIDIDCGCAYGGRLAALRLEDMEEFYVGGIETR